MCLAATDTATPGFERENETKPIELLKLFPAHEALSASKQAESILYSVRHGDYHCSCPDIAADMLISFMSGATPRRFPLLDVLLFPLQFVAFTGFRWYADVVAAQYLHRVQAETAQKQHSN